jgi:type IV secretory pathway VirB2 component (pilin)
MTIKKGKYKIFISVFLVSSVLLYIVFLAPVFAGDDPAPPSPSGSSFPNPLTVNSFGELINKILEEVVLPIGAVIAVLFLIYSGFLFVTARGNEEKLSTAKRAFLWTVVGVAVLLGALVISKGIQETICDISNSIPGC